MIGIVKTLAPANGMSFDDICSFGTVNYIGIFDHDKQQFALICRSDIEFNPTWLDDCKNLDELDDEVFKECGEHIIGVSESSTYTLTINESNY